MNCVVSQKKTGLIDGENMSASMYIRCIERIANASVSDCSRYGNGHSSPKSGRA